MFLATEKVKPKKCFVWRIRDGLRAIVIESSKSKIRISDYPIIRYSDFCEIVYSSRTQLSEAHIGAADNRVYIRARTNIDEYRCTYIFGCVFS